MIDVRLHCSVVDKQPGNLDVSALGAVVKGRVLLGRLTVDFCAGVKQSLDNFDVALVAGNHEVGVVVSESIQTL